MPAVYQGTRLAGGAEPIPNLRDSHGDRRRPPARPSSTSSTGSTAATCQTRRDQTELDARIKSYELAFRMQAEAPEAVDLAERDRRDREPSTASTTRTPRRFGRNCLLARRLVERGVRFVQLYRGAGRQVGRPRGHRGEPRRASAGRWTSRSPACSRT